MVNRERDDNIYYARLAEQGERYEDMIKYMKDVANVSVKETAREPGCIAVSSRGDKQAAGVSLAKAACCQSI